MMMTGSARAAGGALQLVGKTVGTAERDRRFVDDVLALAIDRDVDLVRPLFGLVRIGGRQVDLQLRVARIGRRDHQEDQDDEQHVDQRDQVDLGLFLVCRGGNSRGPFLLSCALAVQDLDELHRLAFHLDDQANRPCERKWR